MIQFGTIYNSPILSNNNQTLTCNQGEGCALLDTTINKNKLYLEINLSTMGTAPYIGIVNADIYTSYTGYAPYYNTANLITTSHGGSPSSSITSIGILSILIDCINKHVKILFNNTTLLLDKNYTFNNANIIIGVGNSGGSGGGGVFTIINKENLKYSIPNEYIYYTNSLNKYLIKQNNQYYSIKPEFYAESTHSFTSLTLSGQPSDADYTNSGFDDIGILTQNMTVGSDIFKPFDKFGETKVTEATFTTTDNKVYTVNPTTNIPFKEGSIIAYENGTVVTPSSIDLANGKVVFSTARTGTMTFDYTYLYKFNIMMYKPN